MAKKLIIGVDVDGVLADFGGAARRLCQALFNGRPADHLVQRGWGFDSIGLSSEEEDELWRTIDSNENWWYNSLFPLPNTNLLKALCDKHRVIFITNRKDALPQSGSMPVNEQTAYWLRNWFKIPNPTVLLSKTKGPLALGLKLDYFVDDRDKNIEEVVNAIGEKKVYGLKATYTPAGLLATHPNWVSSFNEFARMFLTDEAVEEAVIQLGQRAGIHIGGRCAA